LGPRPNPDQSSSEAPPPAGARGRRWGGLGLFAEAGPAGSTPRLLEVRLLLLLALERLRSVREAGDGPREPGAAGGQSVRWSQRLLKEVQSQREQMSQCLDHCRSVISVSLIGRRAVCLCARCGCAFSDSEDITGRGDVASTPPPPRPPRRRPPRPLATRPPSWARPCRTGCRSAVYAHALVGARDYTWLSSYMRAGRQVGRQAKAGWRQDWQWTRSMDS